MGQAYYETVTTIDEQGSRSGTPGRALYRVPRMLLICVFALCIYMFIAIAFTVFVIWRCPTEGLTYRVLPTGHLKVDQFYSGLALSVVFTPAALLLRRLAYEIALLHPFAVASVTPTEMADLDVLMDPGLMAMGRLFKYSISRATAQALIMAAGAFLVPVGTLLVFPGTHSTPAPGTGVVGMPTEFSNMMIMDIEMGGNIDSFLTTSLNRFVGDSIKQMGVLGQLPQRLGPTETANLTYDEGITYNGIVTYSWTSGCEYTDEIHFTEQTEPNAWMFNVTMPDGSQCNNIDAWETGLCVTNVTAADSNAKTTYYAVMGEQTSTVNFKNVTTATPDAITVTDGAWISRVACTPTMNWEVSSCTWLNGVMSDCVPSPGQNTTGLDNSGLDSLALYMSKVPLSLDSEGFYTFGLQTILLNVMFDPQGTNDHQYRAPTVEDFDKMYGLIAQSIVSVATAGYYGTAEVPTIGSSPQPAYLVRTYILAILIVTLVVCPLLPTGILLWNLFVNRTPLRHTTFLTIANAVRGRWWDETLLGTCLMNPSELRRTLRGVKVMFGVTVDDQVMHQPSSHVGFAKLVAPVMDGNVYLGISNKEETEKKVERKEKTS